MSNKIRWTRWHRFDDKGNKYIKRFELNEQPEIMIEEGYTEWKRGTGPLTGEQYENVSNAVRAASKGKPKTPEQKEKMRLAKLGVPKSEDHKKALSKAWEIRRLTPMPEAQKQKISESKKNTNKDRYKEAMSLLMQIKYGNG